LDSTFIKAYSRRNLDNRTGFSDPESLAEHAGEDEAGSQTVCSQIEKRDSRQSIQRQQAQKVPLTPQ
jgi:hypothetical protein